MIAAAIGNDRRKKTSRPESPGGLHSAMSLKEFGFRVR